MSIDTLLTELAADSLASRIWGRDPEAFVGPTAAPAAHDAILNRLGWLAAPTGMEARLDEVRAFAGGLSRDGLTDVYLLGMGGSSLCAEVLRDVTASDATATEIPDSGHTFSTLKHAQAFGDFDALAAAGRRAMHYHFDSTGGDVVAALERVVMGLA
jgi:hypothetical protein